MERPHAARVSRARVAAAAAGGLLLLAALLAVVVRGGGAGGPGELLAGPDPEVQLPTQTSTARSAMPASWLSSSDERSSPLLQDSSDNAVQVLSTPGAAAQPADTVSLAARPAAAPAVRSAPAAPAPAPAPAAKAAAAGGGGSTLGAEASALSSQLASLPKVPVVAGGEPAEARASKPAAARPAAKPAARRQEPSSAAPPKNSWKSMVQKAEEAADKLAEEHPRSVLGAHWRNVVSGNTATLQDASEAAAKAGKAAQDQLVQLAKDNLKQKGIYAPAAMCEKGNFPCPGRLQAQETSTGHYAPVRDNGPSPGAHVSDATKKHKVVMPAAARYPAVSFYAKIREELSGKEHASLAAQPVHRTSLEMLAPGERVRRPDAREEAHREREERRDDEKRREEDAVRRYRRAHADDEHSRRRAHEADEHSRRVSGDSEEEARPRESARGIDTHLYKLFTAPSSESRRANDRRMERATRPSAKEEMSRDSIRSIEGSKLYQEELRNDDDYHPEVIVHDRYDPAAEEDERKRRSERRVKEAQERMAARWRQMMAHPPRPNPSTRPDMLDKRELVRTAVCISSACAAVRVCGRRARPRQAIQPCVGCLVVCLCGICLRWSMTCESASQPRSFETL